MQIYTVKDSILRQRSESISIFELDKYKLLISEMQDILAEDGVGISAVQLGSLLRIFVLYADKEKSPKVFINPELVEISANVISVQEGCLSIPTIFVPVIRPFSATFKYTNNEGQSDKIILSGLEAAVALHEYDHLNGTLFVDRAFNRKNRRDFKKQFKTDVYYKGILDYELSKM